MTMLSKTVAENGLESRRAMLAERLRRAAEEAASVPLSFAQQRLWFIDQLEPNSALYNVPTVVQMTGRLDVPALQKSIEQIVQRHEILRTRFTSSDGAPSQVVDDHVDVQLAQHDLTDLPEAEREIEARRLVQAEVNRPFNLSSGPLVRAALVRIGPDEHRFILNLHHIVSDEWSLKVCFRELTALYQAYHEGAAPQLPELAIQYADFAVWQRDRLRGNAIETQLAYWRDKLRGNPPVLELPSDGPRPPLPTFRGGCKSRELPRELRTPLKDLAARHGASLFMVLLAAFKALLHRYTQHTDIVVGSPVAGRNRMETEDLIGFFVNTVVMRTDVSGNPTFEELLGRVRETALGAFAHQDLPFERLVEELRPERTLNHMPFTRVMFAAHNNGLDELRWPELTLKFIDVDSELAKFDLTFVVNETERGLIARVEFNRDLFQPGTITNLLEHFEVLLQGAASNPKLRLSELPLLTDVERRRVLVDWNDTATRYPRNLTLHELFQSRAADSPGEVGLIFEHESIAWDELNSRANQLAWYLKKFGVGPDVLVGLCVERSVEMVVAMLAIVKAGGAYVPLDPGYPKARLGFMLDDAGAPVLLTQQKLLSRLPRNNARIICLDSDWDLVSRESRMNVPNTATPENLAYVIYTSGSTGRPKGVPVPHRAVSRLVLNTNYIQLSPSDRIAQASNASFDAATFEIWGALLTGARLVGIARDVTLSPRDFARELRERRITVLFLTTALFNQLAADNPAAFGAVRVVLFGGEAVEPKWVRAILRHSPPQHLVHVYGPTENTTFSTWHEVREVPEEAHTIPIGRPVSNTKCYVLDPNLNPVPVGVPGELHVAGDGLARAYWERPDLNAVKFIPNPFRDGDGSEVLYRTGDLVRWLKDGSLEFIGRVDQQVKIRGFRIELGEIETVLSRHGDVRDCAVAVRENGTGDKKLVAYVVPNNGRTPGTSELRQFLRSKLPDYMLPSTFVPLRSLPLTVNGKVDRAALPEPDQSRPELEKRYATPRDAVESELTRIWENVLSVRPIGIEDKFFELGGHSLLAVRVIAQIEKAFGRKLRLATIFQAPTIEQLAAIIRKEIQEESPVGGTPLVDIQPKGARPPLFFVHGAGGGMFWGYVNLSRHLGPDQPVYGIQSRGFGGSDEFPTIEKMAAQYIVDIKTVQPHGPYYLGGYCFGGNVAFEMARQLRDQGEEVAMVALFNCAPANSGYSRIRCSPRWSIRFVRNLYYWGKYFLSWSAPQRREFVRWKKEMFTRRFLRLFKRSDRGTATIDAGELVDLSSYSPEQRRLWEAHIRALIQYHPRPYDGHVELFRSPGHPLLCSFDDDYGWNALAKGGVRITIVPGVHEKILEEPCVGTLGQKLKAILGCNGKKSENGNAPALSLFRRIVFRAGLFFLGAEGLVLLEEGHAAEAHGLAFSMLFQQVAGLCGRKGRDEQAGDDDDATAAPPATPGSNIEALVLPEPLCQSLRELSRTERVPLVVALMAAAKALLIRYSGPENSDGSEFSRLATSPASGAALECSIHDLLLRVDTSGNPGFRQLIQRLRVAAGLSDGQEPFHDDISGAARLFRMIYRTADESGPGEHGFAFGFEQRGDALMAHVEYDPAMLDGESAGRLLGHLKTLIESGAENPDQPVSTLPMLTPAERRRLLVEHNDTVADFPLDRTYVELFEARVARSSTAIAARFRGEELTYAELNARANRLARHLQTLGVGPEALVGVCVERSLDMVVALLGVLKAGGAYLPLDAAYPPERLNYMLQDSGARVLLTQTRFSERFNSGDARVVHLDDPIQRELIDGYSAENPPVNVRPESLAYVIYTSGSTGAPKGVQITNRNLINHNFAINSMFELRDVDRVLQFAAVSFDISVEEIFPTWLAGATLVLRTDEALSSPARFVEFIEQEQLSVLNIPTAYWHDLIEFLRAHDLPESVRLMVIGGEKASDELWRRWNDRFGGRIVLINSYGPTEATVTSTSHIARTGDSTLAIGRPLANVQAVILDPQLQLVPWGVAGELYIGGAGLSRGYLHRPELTAERFVPNPFPEIPSDRLYKTGDLARMRPDGTIEFIGRVDEQVKIRGFRIELGEIEAALLAHPGIRNAAVMAREDVPGNRKLVGYIVPRESAPGFSELVAFLKRKLPAYMIPSAFVQIAELPLTPGGKVNRRALPAPGNERPELEQEFVSPRTPVEQVLGQIWSEVLGISRIGVDDNFFDLGGHSLLATQVVSRIRDALQVEIPLVKIFERPTIGSLAEHLDLSVELTPVLPSSALSNGRRLELTPAQQRIWFLDFFDPQQSAYNFVTPLRVRGRLDVKALELSLTEIARRHEALRTMFPSENGRPVQVICEAGDVHLHILDLSGAPADRREDCAREIAVREARRTFVVSNPMFRPVLLKLSEDESWLLLITHQLAFDGRSMHVLVHDLTACYDAFANGRTPSLDPTPMNYAESLAAMAIAADDEERQLKFWKQNLEGAPVLIDLPADRPRRAHQGDDGARASVVIAPELSAALERLSEEENCPLSVALLAAFKVLLARYSGASDIVVGSIVPNRNRPALENLIGNFENCLSLRTDFTGDPDFRELLRRVKVSVDNALANATVPFERVVSVLQPERNASYAPIYQVAFALESDPLSPVEISGARFEPFDLDNRTSRLDLALHLRRTPEGLRGWIEYSTELFGPARIERLIGHFNALLAGAIENPGERVGLLPLLNEAEANQLLEWNDTASDYPRHLTLVHLFEQQVERTPDATALIAGGDRFTYRELNARANQLAHHLRSLGVGPETLAGVCMHRSWRMIVSILAVLKAGGAYVPLDPAYPKERLALILEDARAPVLLTESSIDIVKPRRGTTVVRLDSDWKKIACRSAENPFSGAEPGNLAYVIYTSGSTGRPKGVALEHRNAVAFVFWAKEVFSREELAGVLASTSVCFDLSIFEMFVPLSWGGAMILAENALTLPGLPARDEVTLINTVPSAMRELLRVKGVPPSVKVVNLAGEPLATPLVNQIYSQTTTEKVYDLYGPTETTTYSTFTLRRPDEPANIGRPLANEQVYLLDANRLPVPVGVPGEIYIGGAGVARGYLNNPELTRERFIDDPFNEGSRLYKTGDLARWRDDGRIEFLGRIDHQVKIRGFRIEPGEIEAALRKHPAVREAVVLAREDQPGDKRLAGYVEPRADRALTADELKEFLKRQLPDYMVPSTVMVMDALPLTPNGKVDRKALPAPDHQRTQAGFTSPRNAMEARLAALWSEILGVEKIGVEDNFFELGGHSLLAIQVIARIREVFKVDLPLFSLFDAPTIAKLAEGMSSGLWTQNQVPILPMQPAPRDRDLPVSFVQERLWFLDQLDPGSHAYNVPMALRLKGRLDPAALQRALNEIARRHESLRTTFKSVDGNLFQVISEPAPMEIRFTDLSEWDASEREARAGEIIDAEAQQPFDLAAGPLARIALVRFLDDDHALLVVMHHTISDGWSLTLFFRELEAFYRAFAAEQPAPVLPELPVQYADFAWWKRQWMQGPVLEKEIAWWKDNLSGAPGEIALPVDRPESGEPGAKGGRTFVVLPKELSDSVAAFGQRNGGTPFMVLMSALAILLQKWTRQRDLVIGTVVAGRTRRETENVIGCFMNFLPIRTKVADDAGVAKLLDQVKASVLEAQAHQECPFEKVVEAVNPARRLNGNPLYNVALLLQNFPADIFRHESLEVSPMPVRMEASLLDLRFEAEQTPAGLSVMCEYRADLFAPETIEQLLASYESIVRGLVEKPEATVRELSITPALAAQAEAVTVGGQEQTIAISATFTAEPVGETVRHWMKELDVPAKIEFAPFNQLFQQLLDPNSELRSNNRGVNVLLIRLEDWQGTAEPSGPAASTSTTAALPAGSRPLEDLKRKASDFVAAVKAAADRSTTPHIVIICPASPEFRSGNDRKAGLNRIETFLASELENVNGVYVVRTRELFDLYPVADYYDAAGDELGKVPYTPVFFTALGTMISRKFHGLLRPAPKVIVLDCDQTLWAGVCGEDGVNGIHLDTPRRALQEFVRAQHEAGRLLATCSKNNEEDVHEVFDKRLDMPLRREHFSAWRLNWQPKSENLKSIAAELNLGLDTFVFIDDNPVECAEVEANCPEVLTLQLPDDPEQIPNFLKHCWIFDTLKLTQEDRRRGEMYRENQQREQLRAQSLSLEDFLAGLDLKISIRRMAPEELPRVAQLTQRTNQFNATTIRRTESEIQQLAGKAEVLTITVSDRFGDYGLVGVVIHENRGDALDVESLLLSCRVLGRGVEYQIIAELGRIAKEQGADWVDVHFNPSPKNKPASDFLERIGANYKQPLNGGFVYRLPVGAAAACRFTSTENGAETTTVPRPAGSVQGKVKRKFARCRSIAIEASDPVKIHDTVDALANARSSRQGNYSPPRSETEKRLCAIWEKLLRIDRVGTRDNFFELGGHSLLAVRLFAEIEKQTGRKFPLVTLFQAPTVEQLARVVGDTDGRGAASPIVPIRSEGSRPPLFLVHGAGGDVLWGYANLVRHMNPDQPVYGIKSRGQIGLDEYEHIEEMARYYIEELKAFQPEGPYYLGGYCFGGNIAYEMARQLRGMGEEVAMVALLDAPPANVGYERVTWWRPAFPFRFARNFGYWLKDFLALPADERRRYVARKMRALYRKMIHRVRNGNDSEPVDLEDVIDLTHFPERELKLWEVHIRAIIEHVERPYGGAVTLFRTRGQPLLCSFEEDFCWGRLARGGVRLRFVPGSHENIFMEPNVKHLAEALETSLAETRAQNSAAKIRTTEAPAV